MNERPNAEIIAVGSELLTEARPETNSLFLADRLNSLGIEVDRKVVVGDSRERIGEAFRASLKSARVILFSGGLGPTTDDITREVVARELDRELRLDESVLAHLEGLYQRFGFAMTENNRRQAMVPQGAEVLPNPRGTAPGLFLEQDDRLIFLLPGPPRELNPMVDEQVLSRIRSRLATRQRVMRQLRVASLGESAVDVRIEEFYRAIPEVETTILSSVGIIDIHFKWTGADDPRLANKTLDHLVAQVRAELGPAIFAEDGSDLEEIVGRQLSREGISLAVAESCTGGLLGKLITDVAGSSEYFLGGILSYNDSLKRDLLGVTKESLREHGAVSTQVAQEMAAGVCRLTGADAGLAITGIAGPGGGTEEKPVGTVCFGLSLRGRSEGKTRRLPGDRASIRLRSARFALDWLRRSLL